MSVCVFGVRFSTTSCLQFRRCTNTNTVICHYIYKYSTKYTYKFDVSSTKPTWHLKIGHCKRKLGAFLHPDTVLDLNKLVIISKYHVTNPSFKGPSGPHMTWVWQISLISTALSFYKECLGLERI